MENMLNELFTCISKDKVFIDEPMKNHTTFKTGGHAKLLIAPQNEEELIAVIKILKRNNVPMFILGNGSNVLVSDKGFNGVIIKLKKGLWDIKQKDNEITALGGVMLSELSAFAMERSLTGLEFASGIPGTVGGGVYMNAGAYDGEIKNAIKEATVYDIEKNEILTLSKNELMLNYRESILQHKNYVLISATFLLKEGNKEQIIALMNDFNGRRRDKQPLEYPSGGSTFKRPKGHFAGKLIEDAGLKGYTIGGAKVSEKHAGFIINFNNATTEDILNLIEYCKKVVKEKFNVDLHEEIRILS